MAALPARALIEPLGPAARWYQALARGYDRRRVALWRGAGETASCFVEESEPDLALLEGCLEQAGAAGGPARCCARAATAARFSRRPPPRRGRRFATRHLKGPTNLSPAIFRAVRALLDGGPGKWRVRGARWGTGGRRRDSVSIFGDEDRGPALRSAIARLQNRYGEDVIGTARRRVK